MIKKEDNYLIGFKGFPMVKGTEIYRETFNVSCRGFTVSIDIIIARGSFGEKDEYQVDILCTSRAEISKNLFLNGWGSYCHIDEAETMRQLARQFAEKYDIQICKECSHWPEYNAVIQTKYVTIEENGKKYYSLMPIKERVEEIKKERNS